MALRFLLALIPLLTLPPVGAKAGVLAHALLRLFLRPVAVALPVPPLFLRLELGGQNLLLREGLLDALVHGAALLDALLGHDDGQHRPPPGALPPHRHRHRLRRRLILPNLRLPLRELKPGQVRPFLLGEAPRVGVVRSRSGVPLQHRRHVLLVAGDHLGDGGEGLVARGGPRRLALRVPAVAPLPPHRVGHHLKLVPQVVLVYEQRVFGVGVADDDVRAEEHLSRDGREPSLG
mmetsp:Transcript_1606/g.6636  ORF Transcript_1606/g.6636 Transcript_1606/m.6636 type:complete len:234 (+) Transcript_1606:1018-1719(+)